MQQSLEAQLSEKLETLFESLEGDIWAEIRKIVALEINNLSDSKPNEKKHNDIAKDLWNYARNLVEKKAREEAKNVLQRMIFRYESFLNEALVRGYADSATPMLAWGECITILSIMAVIRLDGQWDVKENKVFSFYNGARDKIQKKISDCPKVEEEEENDKVPVIFETLEKMRKKLFSKKKQDKIENILFYSLVKKEKKMCSALSSSTWPEVSSEDSLMTPTKCKLIWEQFQAKTLPITQSFMTAQAATIQARKGLFVSGTGSGAGALATLASSD